MYYRPKMVNKLIIYFRGIYAMNMLFYILTFDFFTFHLFWLNLGYGIPFHSNYRRVLPIFEVTRRIVIFLTLSHSNCVVYYNVCQPFSF